MIYALAKHNAAFNRMDRLIKVLMCSSFSPAGLRNMLQKAHAFFGDIAGSSRPRTCASEYVGMPFQVPLCRASISGLMHLSAKQTADPQ